MAARCARFVRSTLTPAERAEVDVVDGIATRLAEYLADHTVEIDGVHVFRASSAKVQAVVGGLLREVGFREEFVHTPQAGFVTRSRADPRREVDLLSAHVFGYGSETPLLAAPIDPGLVC